MVADCVLFFRIRRSYSFISGAIMALTVTSYHQSSSVVIGDHGGSIDHEVVRQDWQLRAVPGTLINGVPAETDGRARPAGPGDERLKLPSRLRPLPPRDIHGCRVTGWAVTATLGSKLEVEHDWRLRAHGLHGQTDAGGIPGTDAVAPMRVTHMFQLGKTPLSMPLSGHAPMDMVPVALPPEFAADATLEGRAEVLAQFPANSPYELHSNPSSVVYAHVYTRASPDAPWIPRYAGQRDTRQRNDNQNVWNGNDTSYLGRVVEADIGEHLTLLKRLGHPGEPQMPISEQTLLIFGDGRQIADRSAPEGIRTMPVPERTEFGHVVPAGHRADGNLAEVAALDTYYGLVNSMGPGNDGHVQLAVAPSLPMSDDEAPMVLASIMGTRVDGHVDDLQFDAPGAHGKVDPFDPRQSFAIGDASFVAADHRNVAILMVKPGHSIRLSEMMSELRAAGLNYPRITVVSGRAAPGAAYSPEHDLSLNPVFRPGDEFRL